VARDNGPPEGQRNRHLLINGCPTELAGSAAGILLANAHLSDRQYSATLTFSRLHSFVFGKLELGSPLERFCAWQAGNLDLDEDAFAAAERRLNRIRDTLTAEEFDAIMDIVVLNYLPGWFFASKLHLRALPEDVARRDALLAGLTTVANMLGIEREREERAK
jgi:hypothetical protein